jgi:aldehyde dehydrogenase (NAD+)
MLIEGKEAMVQAIEQDLRRPAFQAAMLDIAPIKSAIAHALKHLGRWTKPRRVRTGMAAFPGRSWVQYEPLGVVLVIAPWNYPIHLSLAPMVAALAAGNCILLKPSEVTPACSATLADLLPRYLDPSAVKVVQGGPEVTQAAIAQGMDHIFFTGSTAVGRAILAAAAEHLTPVTLELGGKCPAVVTASANLDVAARRIAWGKLTNSGQTCVAPDYVLIDHAVRDAFVEKLVPVLQTFCEGQPVPIVNARHTERLHGLLESAGGTIAAGGIIDIDRAEMQPTVVVEPDLGSRMMREEIFGPLLPVLSSPSLAASIAHIEAGERPLASYLFTEDKRDRDVFLRRVASGGTVINHTLLHLAVEDLPFGGVGASGMGRYHGDWGFETFSNPKAVLDKPSWPDLRIIYPPYRGWAKKLIERAQ